MNDKSIYEKAKEKVYAIYKKPSAYRSGALVKEYKRLGGTYSGQKTKMGLTAWFREKWIDVGKKDYPVYRPTVRVNKATPLTVQEIDPKNLRKQVELKQKIKGKKNLPPFVARLGR